MTLLNTIQKAALDARRARQEPQATLLVTLFSEAANVGKTNGNRETTDAEVVAVVKKFIKGVDETLAVIKPGTDGRYEQAVAEKAVLEVFLPEQLTETQLEAAITDLIGALVDKGPKSMGIVMKQLKERFESRYDGQLASKLIKQALS